MNAIEVKDLFKSYGDHPAVKGISFNVKEGSFFAFLGPNGAGKSTTISIICSLMSYDSGSVSIFGKDPKESRDAIGVVFQDNKLDHRLTVRENVALRGSMYHIDGKELKAKVEKALKETDSLEFADRRYGELSGGQRRRADIARALVHEPKILFLDEPTSGLDPQSRKHIWKMISELDGMTVFLTTHYMEEAADADDVVIIEKGLIVAEGTPAMLEEKYCYDYMSVVPNDMERTVSILEGKSIDFKIKTDRIIIPLKGTLDSIPLIEEFKDMMESFEVRTGSLDDAFINITREETE